MHLFKVILFAPAYFVAALVALAIVYGVFVILFGWFKGVMAKWEEPE